MSLYGFLGSGSPTKLQLGFQPAMVISSFSGVGSTFRVSGWLVIGFGIQQIVGLSEVLSLLLAIAQVLRKGGGLTSLPLGPSIEQPRTLQQLHQNEQESAPTRQKSVFPNLVSKVASHHFRSTLFIRNRSLGSGHIQGEDITQGMNILGQGQESF